ncbi:MAG: sporulation protein YunB [Vulcanibacillus sp.]
MPRWGKKKLNLSKRAKMLSYMLIFISIIIISFIYIESQLEPILINIAKTRVKQIATNVINDAISIEIAGKTNFKDLIQFELDENGNVRAAVFNYSEFASIVGETTKRIEETLNELEKLEESIQFGAVLNSDILGNMGPTIPISIIPVGSVKVSPRAEYQNAGINVVIMTVLIDIQAEVQVVIPFVTESTVIKSSIPIVQSQVFGEVPQFYYDGKGTYYGDTSNSGALPIQIFPETIIPSSQIEMESKPASSNSSEEFPVLGLEEFYPAISN